MCWRAPSQAPAFRGAGADQVAFHVRQPPRTTIVSRPVLSRVHSPVEFDDREVEIQTMRGYSLFALGRPVDLRKTVTLTWFPRLMV